MEPDPRLPRLRPLPRSPRPRPGLMRVRRELVVQQGPLDSGQPWLWFLVACALSLGITAGWDVLMREVPTAARPNEVLARWAGQGSPAEPLLLRAAVGAAVVDAPMVTAEAVVEDEGCPRGWHAVGEFKVTRYVLAREADYSAARTVRDPCGLRGEYRAAFLEGTGVPMQGSGMTLDGRIVRTTGGGCFEESDCALTATGTCAQRDRTVAVDPKVLTLGAPVWIEGLGVRQAEDVGGLVKGHHIDVYEGARVSVQGARDIGVSTRLVCIAGA